MQLCLKRPPAQVFSCECCETFKNSFFYRKPQVTPSVLWTITILNYNHTFENLRTMDDFNFTNFFSDRVMGCSTEGASYYCFRKAGSDNFFQKVLLINSTSFQHFNFAHFQLIEDYGNCTLRKHPIIAALVDGFKIATLRKSSWQISLVLTPNCLSISFLLVFC